MKKTVFILMTSLLANLVIAQSEKFVSAMEQLVPAVDTTHSVEGLDNLANSFERIANAEKTQWLPYYYASFCYITKAYMMTQGNVMGGNASVSDPIADKAEGWLTKADELNKDNSEIYCVKKMLATLRMMGDPMNRYMTFGPAAAEALETAKKLNPDNPRVYLLEAQDKFYTPEQYGGSKEEAKKLFDEAAKKYGFFKPESTIHPSWGMGQVQYFLSQLK